MDTKKVLQQLIKIADNQQKIINKLAQELPNRLEPNPTNKEPDQTLFNALPVSVKNNVASIKVNEPASQMLVEFKSGQKTQANYNVVLKTLQDLTESNVIQHAYQLVVK